jgi:hypothetical protein
MISRLAAICLLMSNTVFAGGIGSGGSPPSVIDIESATMELLKSGASNGDLIRVTSPDEVVLLQPILEKSNNSEIFAKDVISDNEVKFRLKPNLRMLRMKMFDTTKMLPPNTATNDLKVEVVPSDSEPANVPSEEPATTTDQTETANSPESDAPNSNEPFSTVL